MVWQISINKTAENKINQLDQPIRKRIISFLREQLLKMNHSRQLGKALRGDKAELWRFRTGDYRLICKIDDKNLRINILDVGHRKEIYR